MLTMSQKIFSFIGSMVVGSFLLQVPKRSSLGDRWEQEETGAIG